jgi:hypothetical protein
MTYDLCSQQCFLGVFGRFWAIPLAKQVLPQGRVPRMVSSEIGSRFETFGLKPAEDKTHCIAFGRCARENAWTLEI